MRLAGWACPTWGEMVVMISWQGNNRQQHSESVWKLRYINVVYYSYSLSQHHHLVFWCILHSITCLHYLDFIRGLNSRCCSNETPSTPGRNQDYFYPHFIQKCFQKNCHAIYTPLTLNAIQFAQHALARLPQILGFHTDTLVRNAYVADRKTTLLIPV